MIDEREILSKELQKLGIKEFEANVIAFDAGSSQCVVNKAYLRGMKINSSLIDLALKRIVKFYIGEVK